MERIFEILYECSDQKATFFCLGWIAKKYPEIIKKIIANGHEIGTHSFAHQLVYEQKPKEFEKDLQLSIDILEDISGTKIKSYRSPGFSITHNTKWAFEILLNCGISIDCSIFPANRAHGGFQEKTKSTPFIIKTQSGKLLEFPMNTRSILGISFVFSGGGYFRLLPYNLIKQMMTTSEYVMTYFHPRDFDAEQPLIDDLSLKRKFKSYYGLKGSSKKLKKLLNDFDFITLSTAKENINWNNAYSLTFD
jgi:polysaccharide deacetylase family protein (PEP-CTERM system associated)